VADGGLARQLERDAARHLVDALARLNQAGQREAHRRLLDQAVELATRALAAGEQDRASPVPGTRDVRERTALRLTLARAYAARAEDALHGAGQLSQSAQRAPTVEACDDGWRRVAEIVASAEAFAAACASVVAELEREAPETSGARRARAVARRADSAARAARALVEARNHAYTFHTDGRFSFGEGWYLAAAAVLAGVTIQIEPGRPGTVQAERFLRDAGLSDRLVPYRPRPRAMKHVTAIVARAFRADPASAQERLRAAFLGDGAIAPSVEEWIDRTLLAQGAEPDAKKVLVWISSGAHHPGRNTTFPELVALVALVVRCGLVPVLTGDRAFGDQIPRGALDLILFWKTGYGWSRAAGSSHAVPHRVPECPNA
jgi:hypothetical protein